MWFVEQIYHIRRSSILNLIEIQDHLSQDFQLSILTLQQWFDVCADTKLPRITCSSCSRKLCSDTLGIINGKQDTPMFLCMEISLQAQDRCYTIVKSLDA